MCVYSIGVNVARDEIKWNVLHPYSINQQFKKVFLVGSDFTWRQLINKFKKRVKYIPFFPNIHDRIFEVHIG